MTDGIRTDNTETLKNALARVEELEEENAELKARLPQWTEVESNTTPNREISKKYMPAHKRKVLLKYRFINKEEVHISEGYFDNYDHTFHIPNNPTCRIICVIAWAEFKE